MKILFTARHTLFSQPGGDTQQVLHSADALRALGVEVDILLRGEKPNYTNYDVVHFFNLGRPADIIDDLEKITQPLVVSSIWVDYREFDKYRGGIGQQIQHIFGNNRFEYLKAFARAYKGNDIFPGLRYGLLGHEKSVKKIAQKAAVIIASSQSEKNRISKATTHSKKTHVLPLGLPAHLLASFKEESERSGVICVGRIEGLKNQLNLIKAANGANWELKIIGKAAANQPKYEQDCVKHAGENVRFEGWLDSENLIAAYRSAKVLVLPSFFETFGLVALEAMSQGCNVVIADRPDMNSIFRENVLPCNPHNPNDIRQKIEEALILPVYKLSREQRETHNWPAIAKQILAIYSKQVKK